MCAAGTQTPQPLVWGGILPNVISFFSPLPEVLGNDGLSFAEVLGLRARMLRAALCWATAKRDSGRGIKTFTLTQME